MPEDGTRDPDRILDRFLDWVADVGLTLYPAQEEAILELMAGKHVILNTPTGSGKSLVALGAPLQGAVRGARPPSTPARSRRSSARSSSRSASDFGAENVGMLTGDASDQPRRADLCCTAEILANMALRDGASADAPTTW